MLADATTRMKCEACKKAIEYTFLGKILGTRVKDSKGKMHAVCFECQKKLRSKEAILNQIK
jgi:hypothetical protein